VRVSAELEAKILDLARVPDDAPSPVVVTISEAAFQRAVTDYAESRGWSWHHQQVSKRSKAGWPDLALFRERAVYVEVKAEDGRLSADQERWRDILQAAGCEWYCWRPSSWDEVRSVLGGE